MLEIYFLLVTVDLGARGWGGLVPGLEPLARRECVFHILSWGIFKEKVALRRGQSFGFGSRSMRACSSRG